MKKIIAAAALAALAGPAFADHAEVTPLYHQVTRASVKLSHAEVRGHAEFNYAPLYVTVKGTDGRFQDEDPLRVAGFSYSPLYLQVIMGRKI